jgi:hypothetical protein
MPRSTTLLAFCATVAIAVPAGWHVPDADIRADGKRLRPLGESFTVDGATVKVEVDRALIMTGDSVNVTLVAESETPKKVTVDLLALQSNNYEGARVESPEIAINHEKIVLQAAPGGGKPVVTRMKLGDNPNRLGVYDNFRIYVRPRGMKLPKHEYLPTLDYTVGIEEGTAAAVRVLGWSGSSLGITIEPEGPVVAAQPVTFAVKVKNTTGRQLPRAPSISLGNDISGYGGVTTSDDFEIEPVETGEDATGGGEEVPMKRGAVVVQKFVVVPKLEGGKLLTLAAAATVWNNDIGPTLAGALDVRSFEVQPPAAPTESTPTFAAK